MGHALLPQVEHRVARSHVLGARVILVKASALVHEVRDARLKLIVLILEHLLLDADLLHDPDGVSHLLIVVGRAPGRVVASPLHFLVEVGLALESKFFLHPRDFVYQLSLVKRLFGYHLASEILDLGVETFLDGIVLFAHDVAPDGVELVKNLTHARLSQLTLVLLLQLQQCSHRLRRNPVVILLSFSGAGGRGGPLGRSGRLCSLLEFVFDRVGCLHDVVVVHVGVLTGAFEQFKQTFVVVFKRLELDLLRAVAFTRAEKILHRQLNVHDLLAELVVLSVFKLELIVKVFATFAGHVELCGEMHVLLIALLKDFLDAVDLNFPDVDFLLVLLDLGSRLVMDLFLRRSHTIELVSHVLDLFSLG